MKQHLHLITLGVRNFGASRQFYTEVMGWKPTSASQDDIAFFQAGGVLFSIYPREKLAEDALVSAQGTGFAGMTLACNVGSEAEVDETLQALKLKGARIIKEPQKVFWGGYSAYFADPDGYLWEVAYNPFLVLDENGNPAMD